jgi:DNA-binding MarR family transcriptional regulator
MGAHTSKTDETRRVLDAVRRIVHTLRESSRWAEQSVGLSGAQLFVLQKLAESPAVSVNELAARTHTHQSSVSTVVARLVERGLVRRARSGADRRSVELSLSSAGERLVTRAPDVAQERLIRSIEQLPIAGRRQLATSLSALAEAIDTTERAPVMFFEEHGSARRSGRRATATRGETGGAGTRADTRAGIGGTAARVPAAGVNTGTRTRGARASEAAAGAGRGDA